jgi:hypothetical protein
MDTDFLARPLTYRLSLITYHFLRHGFTRDAHGFQPVIPAKAGIQSLNHEGHEAPSAASGRNQRMAHTKPPSSQRRALRKSSPNFVALRLRVRTKYLSCKGLHRVKICAGKQDLKK